MKKIIFLIAFFGFQSCGQSEKEELENKNKQLLEINRELEQQLYEEQNTKFVFTVIINKQAYSVTPNYSKDGTSIEGTIYGDIRTEIYFTEIQEITGYTKSMNYKMQDDLEYNLRNESGGILQSIDKRETYAFDTYEEASKFKFNLINN